MNAPLRPDATPRLEDFPYRLSDNVRFADLDPNQHVNNAVYATYFETGRVTLMKDRSYGLMPDGVTWIMVRLDMHFRAELRWPGTIEMGLGVVKFGRTSVTFDQVVFSEGKCVASAQSVSVLLDEATRKPTPLTPEILANFQPWIRRGSAHDRAASTCSRMRVRLPSTRANRQAIALKVFRTSGLPLRRRHHEAVEFVAHLDLARQARIRPHVETEIQHVLFHRRRRADLLAPGFVDIDVAGRAGAGAAAFGFDAGNGVADRGFHHGRAVLDFDGSFFAGMVDKVDFGHDRSCCRNM